MMTIYLNHSFDILVERYLHILTINQEEYIVQQLIILIFYLLILFIA